MTKRTRLKYQLKAQSTQKKPRGDTWVGLRPKKFTNSYFQTSKQRRRADKEACKIY